LAEALKNNHKLTSLNLGSNAIEAEGARALAAALNTSALTSLHLSGCSINDEGAQALAEVLADGGAALTTLDLGHNAIGREGAEALAKALMANDVLTSLLLRGNWLRDAGARALAQAFGALTSLDLGSNAINDEGAIALIEAHKKNSALTSLLLKGNSVTYSRTHSVGVDFETELAEALKAASLEERRSKCDLILDKLKATAAERVASENAAAEKAAADRAAEEQAAIQKAYTEAYTKGFNDGRAGRDFAPIADPLEPTSRLEKDEV
jgi:Ran GTPase-activating protein (RanGAP) involved in mRNA processing and transport